MRPSGTGTTTATSTCAARSWWWSAGEPDGELFNGDYATNYQSGAYKADEAYPRGARWACITLVDAAAAAPRLDAAGRDQRRAAPAP